MALSGPGFYQAWPSFTIHLTTAAFATDAAGYAGTNSVATSCVGTAAGPRDLIYIRVTPNVTTTFDNILRLFFYDGTNKARIAEYYLDQITLQANRVGQYWTFPIPLGVFPLKGAAHVIYISQEKADDLEVIFHCGDYQP